MWQVRGLKEWQRDLLRSDPAIRRAFSTTHKAVSEKVVEVSRPNVKGLPSPGGSLAISGIKPMATPTHPRVKLDGGNPTVKANVFGARSHVVWGRRKGGRGPWQPWLGNSWSNDELYGIGPAFKQVADSYAPDEYAEALMRGLRQAFPN